MRGHRGMTAGVDALRVRERVRRRFLFITVSVLALVGMTPVFGHHLAPRVIAMGAGSDHIFGICLVALHEIFQPVHDGFHILLALGLAYAVLDRGRAWIEVRRTLGSLRIAHPLQGDIFSIAAIGAGVRTQSIFVVRGLPASAFTAGWLRPRIYVSARLGTLLTPRELSAVIAHEAAHVRARDPLRLSALRFLANSMFYLPTLRRLIDDLADEAEISADDSAVRELPARALDLASALVTVAEQHAGAAPAAAVGFQRSDLLGRRVRRLAGERTTFGTHVTRRSLVGAAAMLLLVWVSGLIMASPLAGEMDGRRIIVAARSTTAPQHSRHCVHKGMWAVGHLFCEGHARATGITCPHTAM
ncbi:MAG: M56 family metallopeptidase [Longimicrobiales bacterium]